MTGTTTSVRRRDSGSRDARLRVGVVGLRRGRVLAQIMAAHPDARLAALCDSRTDLLGQVADGFADLAPARCSDLDQLLDADLDAVVLANDATAHVPLAVTALDAGLSVLSEVPAAATMAESVRLVEAAARSTGTYMMAENYCMRPTTSAIRRRYLAGDLGEFQHGEGEYVHDTEQIWPQITGGRPDHWRNRRTATFYCTHSLGPILHVTGARVTRVVAMETPDRVGRRYGRLHGDAATLLCQTSDDGTIKSLQSHGGLRREPASTWVAVYGTRGSMETDRWNNADVWTYLTAPDGSEGTAERSHPLCTDDLLGTAGDASRYDGLIDRFRSAHGGSDLITSHRFLQAALGRAEVPIDAYRATDMSLPGLLAFRSIRNGNVPYDVPDLRDAAERDRWRDDDWAPFPTAGRPAPTDAPCSYPVEPVAPEVYTRVAELAHGEAYPAVERM